MCSFLAIYPLFLHSPHAARRWGACADCGTWGSVCRCGVTKRDWHALGARCQTEARAFYIATLRRQLGVHTVREMARHRLRRLPLIGVPRSAVIRRREMGMLRTGGDGARQAEGAEEE